MPRTLVVTNDFPPRIGGIESFVSDVCELLDHDVLVYASGPAGASATDTERGYPVVRAGSLLLPTRRVAAEVTDLVRRYGITRVVFGAAAPLGLLGPGCGPAGVERIVGLTHGHETWWATLPGARALLHRIGESCDHLTVVSEFTERRISTALSPGPVPGCCGCRPGGHRGVPARPVAGPRRPAPDCRGRPVRRPEGASDPAAGLAAGGRPVAGIGPGAGADPGRRRPAAAPAGAAGRRARAWRSRAAHRRPAAFGVVE